MMRARISAPTHPSNPTFRMAYSLRLLILFFFLFLFRLFVARGDEVFFAFVALRRFSGGRRERLFFLRRFFDDAAAARRRIDRRFLRVALIGAALRAERNRLPEVVELRVTAVTGVLPTEISHLCPEPPQKSGDRLAQLTRFRIRLCRAASGFPLALVAFGAAHLRGEGGQLLRFGEE